MVNQSKRLKYRNYLVKYTEDFEGKNILVNQRVYINNEGKFLTPITDKFLERADPNISSPKVNLFNLRRAIAASRNAENQSKKSEFFTIIPFLPGSIDFKEQIRQTLALEGIECVEYLGEDRRKTRESGNF